MKNKEKHEIISNFHRTWMFFKKNSFLNFIEDFLSKAPSSLTVDDLDDFCSLANHYASNTPQSFRKVSRKIFLQIINWCICKLGILFVSFQRHRSFILTKSVFHLSSTLSTGFSSWTSTSKSIGRSKLKCSTNSEEFSFDIFVRRQPVSDILLSIVDLLINTTPNIFVQRFI